MTGRLIRQMLTFLLIATAGLLIVTAGTAVADVRSGTIAWRDLDTALAESKAEGKPVMIHFTAEWCGWCTKMKKEVYGLEDVATVMNRDFVPAIIDTDRRPDLKAAYGVQGLPTIWFIDSAGEGITYIPGYVDAATFRQVLRWVGSGAYAEKSFEEFIAAEG